MRRLRTCMHSVLLTAVILGAQGLALNARADDASEFGKPSQDFLDQKAALDKFITDRDIDLFELAVQPLDFDEVRLKDRLGQVHVYNYLTFRLRNEIVDATRPKMAKPSRYNEILKTIADQYEFAKVNSSNGGQLVVDTSNPASSEGVILERQDLKARTRSVNITVLVSDEHGSRIHLLDDPVGSGSQEHYNFPDYGEMTRDEIYKRIREEVEEKASRRLHTLDEIRAMKLPPFDASKVDEEGVAEGEVYGVVLFDRLSLYGHQFTIYMRGLSNKMRFRHADNGDIVDEPEVKPGEIDNYLAMRVMRRVYVLHYSHLGDEFYRNLDTFTLERSGWEWVDTFQRIQQRKNIAYARYYLNNITDDKDVRNQDVEKDFWGYYSAVRAGSIKDADKLPDLEKTLNDRAPGQQVMASIPAIAVAARTLPTLRIQPAPHAVVRRNDPYLTVMA